MSSTETYKYTILKDAALNSVLNVIGVIKYARQSRPKREHHVFLSLTDESIFSTKTSKISTNAFVINSTNLDEVRPHRIVRMHRLKFESFQGSLQGISRPGCHFIVLDERPGASLEPLYSSSHKHSPVTQAEARRIEELRLWLNKNMTLFERCEDSSPMNFSDVEPGQYFTNICQVLSNRYNGDLKSHFLHVTDGTSLKMKLHRRMPLNEVIDQNMWNCPLADLEPIVLEIEVHESHADVLGGLEAGEFLRLKNLHVFLHSDTHDNQNQQLTFQLHKGTVLVQKVPSTSYEAREISSRLKPLGRSNCGNSNSNFSNGKSTDANSNRNLNNNLLTSSSSPPTVDDVGCVSVRPPLLRLTNNDPRRFNSFKYFSPRLNCNNNEEGVSKQPTSPIGGINHVLIQEDDDDNDGNDDNDTSRQGEGIDGKFQRREMKRKTTEDENDQGHSSKRVKFQLRADLEQHLPPINNRKTSGVDSWTQTDGEFKREDYMFWPSSDSSDDDDDDDNGRKRNNASNGEHRSKEPTTLNRSYGAETGAAKTSSRCRQMEDSEVIDDSIRRQWDGVVISFDSSMSCDENDVYYRQESQGYAGKQNNVKLTLKTCHVLRETCTLKDVIGTFPPMNFKVKARVEDYFPKPDLDSLFVQLHCSTCDFVLPLRCLSSRNPNKKCTWDCKRSCSQVDRRQRSPCPQCKLRGRTVQMRHIFTFQILMVEDMGTKLCVNLWGNEANKLLGKPRPKNAVSTKSKMKELKEKMDGIIGSSVDCCIASSAQNGVAFFQIFDTFLVTLE